MTHRQSPGYQPDLFRAPPEPEPEPPPPPPRWEPWVPGKPVHKWVRFATAENLAEFDVRGIIPDGADGFGLELHPSQIDYLLERARGRHEVGRDNALATRDGVRKLSKDIRGAIWERCWEGAFGGIVPIRVGLADDPDEPDARYANDVEIELRSNWYDTMRIDKRMDAPLYVWKSEIVDPRTGRPRGKKSKRPIVLGIATDPDYEAPRKWWARGWLKGGAATCLDHPEWWSTWHPFGKAQGGVYIVPAEELTSMKEIIR